MVASSLAEDDAPTPITTPTTVLWQSDDPLFPRAWSDRLDRFFGDVTLRPLDGVGHFAPLEAPQAFADAIDEFLRPRAS
jgi:pimeloyl-ACP methyl ester carboxylesterase